jgi:hypothetical protein
MIEACCEGSLYFLRVVGEGPSGFQVALWPSLASCWCILSSLLLVIAESYEGEIDSISYGLCCLEVFALGYLLVPTSGPVVFVFSTSCIPWGGGTWNVIDLLHTA